MHSSHASVDETDAASSAPEASASDEPLIPVPTPRPKTPKGAAFSSLKHELAPKTPEKDFPQPPPPGSFKGKPRRQG